MVAVFSEYFYMLSFNLFVISYIAYYKIGRFIFLSIPIPVFIPSDRFARNGPVRLSLISSVLLLLGKTKDFAFLSLIRRTHWPLELLASSSDTTGRAFRKSKTTLARAPMVPQHEHRRRTSTRIILHFRINMYINTLFFRIHRKLPIIYLLIFFRKHF